MEVILLEDVEALGHEGDIVRVADGHARNYLIPKKLAVKATRAAKADLERRRHAIAQREAQKAQVAQELAARLHEKPLVITAKSGEGGRLHGTVTAQQIAEALANQAGIQLDKRRIHLVAPIRELGDYLVTARLYKDVTAQLTITVIAEGQKEEETETPEAASQETGGATETSTDEEDASADTEE